ncbi:Pvc16 family protein [Nitratireductor sp. XY-223]|uniref:Pvc16 family protein n=1 Tax=Nitratireductor sp. XY-223 TaxID=2561926 RepID=UPI0010AA04F8|nr:Pvc16 family protein [Nitratireductor sp. XY-223]
MSLLDLSLVTRSFTEFVARTIELSPAWQPRARPTVSPLPPDQMAVAGLSFYLYHVTEVPQHKNPAPAAVGSDAIRFTPMAVELHYQMSPVASGQTAAEMHEAQLLFGCALKALHDAPEINDETAVNGANVFDLLGLGGADNRFRLQYVPVMASDAVNFWTAGSSAMRLAAYYSAAVVYLDPEAIAARSGRVLSYSISAFPSGSPFVSSSESQTTFTLPGGQAQTITTSPAVVPYGGELVLTGANFTGERVDLLLRGNGDDAPRVADAGWAIVAQPTRLSARVARTADGRIMLPGAYAASVRTGRTLSGRMITSRSNVTPIQITPAVDLVTDLGGGLFRIDGGLFADPDIAPEDVEVHAAAEQLTLSAGAPAAGEYQVVSADRIELQLPAGFTSGTDVPLRILVNGAETPPVFVRVP